MLNLSREDFVNLKSVGQYLLVTIVVRFISGLMGAWMIDIGRLTEAQSNFRGLLVSAIILIAYIGFDIAAIVRDQG
jgi:hypothetical protein